MTATMPDRQTVLSALRLANRAPSVHNTQPWRWLIDDRAVHLMADRTRRVPATDPDERDLIISCGAALHHLRVALAALGRGAEVRYLPDTDPDHLAAVTMPVAEPSEEDVAMARAIPRRRTDRRGFTSWPVPRGHLDLMTHFATELGCLLVPVTDPDHRHVVTTAIAAAAWWQDSDPIYREEMAKWSGRAGAATEGVPAANTPPASRVRGDTSLRTFPGGHLTEPDTGPGDDDGELLVLATTDDDVAARLRAGEAASAALLAATSLDLATCPLSQPLEVRNTRARIRHEVLGDTAHPQLVLRVGWVPTSAPPLARSGRRAVDETVGYLPGAGRDEG